MWAEARRNESAADGEEPLTAQPASRPRPSTRTTTAEPSEPSEPPPTMPERLEWSNGKREDKALPSQGFRGSRVEHNNMKTVTSDWLSEHGNAGVAEACAQYTQSRWCEEHGYALKQPTLPPPKSASDRQRVFAAIIFMIVGETARALS